MKDFFINLNLSHSEGFKIEDIPQKEVVYKTTSLKIDGGEPVLIIEILYKSLQNIKIIHSYLTELFNGDVLHHHKEEELKGKLFKFFFKNDPDDEEGLGLHKVEVIE